MRKLLFLIMLVMGFVWAFSYMFPTAYYAMENDIPCTNDSMILPI